MSLVRKRRRALRGIVLALVALGLPVALVRHSGPTPLLSRATRVTDAAGGPRTKCFWVSNRQVLLIDSIARSHEHVLTLVNVPHGPKTVLRSLSKRFGRSIEEFGVTLSPDGKWLVWEDRTSSPVAVAPRRGSKRRSRPAPVLTAAALDGSRVRRWPRIDEQTIGRIPSLLWLPDGRHLVEIRSRRAPVGASFQEYALIHSLDTEGEPHELQPAGQLFSAPIGTTKEGNLLALDCRAITGTRSDLPLMELALSPPCPTVRRFSVPLPHDSRCTEYALSPQRDRFALTLIVHSSLPGRSECQRILWLMGMRPSSTLGLWVTGLHDNSLHCVGTFPLDPEFQNMAPGQELFALSVWDAAPSDLHWLPDGKHLSFVYKHALYTVPSD